VNECGGCVVRTTHYFIHANLKGSVMVGGEVRSTPAMTKVGFPWWRCDK